jgi:hypothetical protein
MLGKLWKHEVKSSIRVYGLMYLVVAIFTGLLMMYESLFKHIRIQNEWMRRFTSMITSMGSIGYLLILVTVNLLTLVYLIYRFYQTMISDQGYLTHTLPVTTGQLIFVKTVAAFCFRIVSFLVSVLSILLVIVSTGDWNKFVMKIQDLLMKADELSLRGSQQFIVFLILAVLCSVFSGLFKILEYYTCLSAGNLFDSHKLAGSVVVYLVFNVVLGIVRTFLMLIGMDMAEKWSDNLLSDRMEPLLREMLGLIDIYMAAGMLLMAAGCGILFAVSRYLLKNRLNLA